jgi:succinate dehydrogenase / fumarate reductase membrane anchor subunit
MTENSSLRSPLAKARGHGSAKTGTDHWWLLKVTAVVLIPLTLWFFLSMVQFIATGAAYNDVIAWLQTPWVAGLMIAFLAMNFYHAALGGVEVILDYVPHHLTQIIAVMLYQVLCAAGGLASILSVLYIAFRM